MSKPRCCALFLALLLALQEAWGKDGIALKWVQSIALPDVDGRIDHFAVDIKTRRAFLAALSRNTIEVVDLDAARVAGTITGFSKPQGVLLVQGQDRLVVASGGDGTVKFIDATTLALVHVAQVSPGADAIGFDAAANEIYVGSGGADANKEQGDLTVIDVASARPKATLATEAHAGGSVVEARGKRVFVLVPEKGQVLVLDRTSHATVATWTIPGIQRNVALALDEQHGRLFVGVRTPASIVVLDSASGVIKATVPVAGLLDGLSYDPATRRIYTSGGEGFVDVTQQIDADHYERIARLPTGPGARTSVFVPAWHRLYVAVPRDQGRVAELRVYEVVP